MVTDAVAACIRPGDHGTTFGGNPFVAAAAQVVFRRVANAGFLAASCERGAQLARTPPRTLRSSPRCARRSTAACLWACSWRRGCSPSRSWRRRCSAACCSSRPCPPLNICAADVDFGLRVLRECFDELAAATGSGSGVTGAAS